MTFPKSPMLALRIALSVPAASIYARILAPSRLEALPPRAALRRLLCVRENDVERAVSYVRHAFDTWPFAAMKRRCLYRSLAIFYILKDTRPGAKLVFGIKKGARSEGHAWVEVDGTPVHESQEKLHAFERIPTPA